MSKVNKNQNKLRGVIMKKFRFFLLLVLIILIIAGFLQLNQTYAIPYCSDVVCKSELHYCDSTPCYCPDTLVRTNCLGYCSGICADEAH